MNGKERMAKLIGKKVTSLKNAQQSHSIPQQWRDNCINTAGEVEETQISDQHSMNSKR
jgi:predicted transcriptional regulator YdeE